MPLLYSDSFTGADNSSWTSDWSFDGGVSGDEPVLLSGNGAFTNQQVANQNWHATLTAIAETDSEQTLLCRYISSSLATWGLVARWSATNDYYRLRYVHSSGELRIEVNDQGSFDVIGQLGLDFIADFYIKFRVEGTQLRAKAWATTSTEPDSWILTVSDATHAGPGRTGIHLYGGPGDTIGVDDYMVESVQYIPPSLSGAWGAIPIGVTPPAPPPLPPPPAPASWQDAVDTRTYPAVEAWYVNNTGHEALGIAEEDLVPGSLISEYDGQIFEGIIGSHIRIGHSNVTYRGCRVLNGSQYGVYHNPTFGSTHRNTTIEYCTLVYDEVPDRRHGALELASADLGPGAGVIRNCNLYGWTSGGAIGHGWTSEYNWFHDAQIFSGIHSTSLNIDGNYSIARRNYYTDGTSGILNCYFDKGSVANHSRMQENILNGSSPNASPSYLILLKAGDQQPLAVDFKIEGNYFGDEYQFGIFAGGGDIRWGEDGNARTGNQMFLTGIPFGNIE